MMKDVIRFRAETIYHGMLGSFRKFGTEFDKEYFSVNNIYDMIKLLAYCPCCKQQFIFESLLTGHKNINAPSADRINSDLGYTKENVVFICWGCNLLKRDTTVKELEIVVNWLEQKLKNIDNAA